MDDDEVLNALLLQVPENASHQSRKRISSNKKDHKFGSGKKLRLSSSRRSEPEPRYLDFDDDDDDNDDFEEDQLKPAVISSLKEAIKIQKQAPPKQEAVKPNDLDEVIFDDFDDQFKDDDIILDNDAGVKAAPLNDDLRSNLEFLELEDGTRKFTRFYWYDCYEDQSNHPGVVYFFGRIYAQTIKKYVSCCTIVKNIKKTCYLLIKENCTYDEVVGEFTHIIAKKYKIQNFTCKEVEKKYAFSKSEDEIKVPMLAKYVELEYPVSKYNLPLDLKGETFSKVLNINQTPMEKLILNMKLRGPCWFKLVDPVTAASPLTWSRIELVLETPDNLIVEDAKTAPKAPYFCAFSLSMQTYPNPITHQNEIIAIAGMVNSSFNLDQCLKRNNKASGHFLIMTKPADSHKELRLPYDYKSMLKKFTKTRFQLVESERDLLTTFMEQFENLDPDLVVGHDLINFDYETLISRMIKLKVGVWSKLGRFKKTNLPSTKAAFRYLFSGRPICDIRTSAMELIHARSYDLNELTSQVLQKTRIEYNHKSIVEAFKSSEKLIQLLNATWEDTDNIFSILVELNIIPLALKITNITGNILSRTLTAGRSERNEHLLLHAFHEENFICPEKLVQLNKDKKFINQPTRKKAAYSGGLVLEPKTDYYDTCILLMDFNSLYPSIIQEFNICFSTIKLPEEGKEDELNDELSNENFLATGILPSQLKKLVEGRRRVKRLMGEAQTSDQKLMLDIEQKALKLTANSMYGCLGFEHSRFYAKHLASLVTFKGREILMSTKARVEELGYEVIYGDTDSLMINTKLTNFDEVMLKGNSIKSNINATFKLLEIDIDGVYRPLLLLKKKNYAGALIKKSPDGQSLIRTIETKGLDTVRRDRAIIAKEAGEKVLSMILDGDKEIESIVEDIHNYLRELGESIRNNQVELEKFLISKQLNKNPEDYRETKGVGHVSLALRYNQDPKRSKKMKSGDTVEYLICTDKTDESANQRAYSLEELKENLEDKLAIDFEYYLCQQIHPIMVRICDKLPTTNAYTLAEMLGIEKSSMLHIKRDDNELTKKDQLVSRGEARFLHCKPLEINCPSCFVMNEISTKTRKNSRNKSQMELSLTNCQACDFRFPIKSKQIQFQIIKIIKKLNFQLFSTKFVCENGECNNYTRNVLTKLSSQASSSQMQVVCQLCDSFMLPEMDDRKLDLQLNYYKHLFDIRDYKLGGDNSNVINDSSSSSLPVLSEDLRDMYEKCHGELDYALRSSFINNIDTYETFSTICSGRALRSQQQ